MKKNIIIHIAILLSCTAYGMGPNKRYQDLHLAIINSTVEKQKKLGATLSRLESEHFEIIDMQRQNTAFIAIVKQSNGDTILRTIKQDLNDKEYCGEPEEELIEVLTIDATKTNKSTPSLCSTSEPCYIKSTIAQYFPHLLYNEATTIYTLPHADSTEAFISISAEAIDDEKVGEIITELEKSSFTLHGIKKAYRIEQETQEPTIIVALSKLAAYESLEGIERTSLGKYITILKRGDKNTIFIDPLLQ
ncbi:MAG: hypothetical protein WC707_06705 [Candidatus Babeliaceae bacterium]|jgi:hypothetical protein